MLSISTTSPSEPWPKVDPRSFKVSLFNFLSIKHPQRRTVCEYRSSFLQTPQIMSGLLTSCLTRAYHSQRQEIRRYLAQRLSDAANNRLHPLPIFFISHLESGPARSTSTYWPQHVWFHVCRQLFPHHTAFSRAPDSTDRPKTCW